MAIYNDNFNADTVDSPPPDYTQEWAAPDSILVRPATDGGTSFAAEAGTNCVAIDAGGFDRCAWSRNGASAADTLITGFVAANVDAQQVFPQIIARGSGNEAGRTGYALWVRRGTSVTYSIYKFSSGTETQLATSPEFSLGADNAVFFEFSAIDSGSDVVLEARVWPLGGSRPATADMTYTDTSSPIASGWPGIGAVMRNSTTDRIRYGYVEIKTGADATGGGGGGTPVSNATPAAIEARAGLYPSCTVPIEHRAPSSNGVTAAQEAQASRAQSAAALIEVVAGIDAATAVALEALAQPAAAGTAAHESRAPVDAGRLSPHEAGHALIAAVYGAQEALLSLSRARQVAHAFGQAVDAGATVAWEAQGAAGSVSNSVSVSLEARGFLSRAGAAPFAVLRGLVRGAAGGYEVGASLVVAGTGILEALRGLQGDGAAAFESLGAPGSVSNSAAVPIEFIGTRLAGGTVAYESLVQTTPVSRQVAVSVEALAILRAAAGVPIEAAGLEFYPSYEDLVMALSDEAAVSLRLEDAIAVTLSLKH